MAEFKLAASLQGHEDDVRAVAFPNPKYLLSASRDGSVRAWSLTSAQPLQFDDTIALQSSSFVNSLAFVPPSKQYPTGLIASAGKDTIIDVRQPGQPSDHNAERLLLGHAHNVCTLDAFPDGQHLVSGGWDKQARVWDIDRGQTVAELQGHEASVWSVLVYDHEHILTACADKHIRIFHPSGKLLKDIGGLPDVVRALCKLPSGHDSGAAFASSGNDQIIRLWTLDGLEASQLHGHEAFVYSLAILPTGEIVSSSEDRTVRIWRGSNCIQTITHPAISVWTVAVCKDNGDIVTGASDRMVRVFTRDTQRQADAETLKAFSDSVQASSIPQQTTGDGQNINKEKLPGPDFLKTKSGTKEGQVQMIREDNGNVTAHTWSTAAQQWINVGNVVDSVGSSGRKVTHNGHDYDYVFDVDIEDGKPPLKLPFNTNQNPYEVAQKFIADNELPISYLDQVANFILQNTQGANIGSAANNASAMGSDPWGTGNRYRPGEAEGPTPSSNQRPRSLPQKNYLSITTANLPAIRKKIMELNEMENGPNKLETHDVGLLDELVKQLTSKPGDPKATQDQLHVIFKMMVAWPPASRLPALDLLRLCAVSKSFRTTARDAGHEVIEALTLSEVFGKELDRPNNTMMAIRVLVNMFEGDGGRGAGGDVEQVLPLVDGFTSSANKNLTAALATLLINVAVFTSQPAAATNQMIGEQVLKLASELLQSSTDSETTYRSLVALGTILATGGGDQRSAAQGNNMGGLLDKVSSSATGKEPRVKHLIEEVKELL